MKIPDLCGKTEPVHFYCRCEKSSKKNTRKMLSGFYFRKIWVILYNRNMVFDFSASFS